ncbi:galactose ABC transporter substrate-binding protein [Clostridium sp.]|uniref:galactose ABC transporter substrate-binding protein n=1 Tax=Clostridium sp. TaxID=1506 RepID=UPI002601E8E5|nr:galactose ABC transporter substrate-binding protein [Clostridium sp.]
MKILRKIIVVITVGLLIIFTTANFTQVSTLASPNTDLNNKRIANVAVIIHRLYDPYMMELRKSLENIEQDKNNNVKFTFFDAKNNIAIQNEIIDSALRSNYDLLILNLAQKNENILEDIINRIKQRNIPVILMNIPPETVSQVSRIYNKAAFVIPDSKQAGIEEGKILVNLWNTNKAVLDKNNDNILQYVLLQGEADDPQAIDRTKYAISTINDSGIKTQQLALVTDDWIRDLAKVSMDGLFLNYNGRIEAIIANNDAMALGAIDTLQKYGYNKGDKSKNIAVVGIDALPEAKDLIDKGFMTGTIVQDSNVLAKMLYSIGINLSNNLAPTENTNYNTVKGEIIIPYNYEPYISKANTS